MGLLSTIGAASGRAFGLTRVGAAIRDAYFNLTTLLLPGNGTNGAQNNTFLDSSSNNFTITRNGNTTQGSFSPFSQTGWSNFFTAASSQFISLPNNAAFQFGAPSGNTNDFVVEFFVYPTTTAISAPVHTGYTSGTTYWGFNLNRTTGGVNTAGHVQFYLTDSFNVTATTGLISNQQNHICAVRTGTTVSLFVNGVRQATGTSSVNPNPTGLLYVGGEALSLGRYLDGYVSNLRIIKNATLPYDANALSITVPTSQLTAITGTTVLTCQSNRFVDNSTNNFTISTSGTPSVQAFSPFAPTAAYDAATVGGSGYFDGTGDYLSVASNAAFQFGTGDFTVEAWWYPTTISSTYQTIAGVWVTGNLGWILQARSTDVLISIGSGFFAVTGSATIVANQWYHVAASRNGTTVRVFLNGTQLNTGTSSASGTASTALQIGRNEDGNQQYVNGYLSSLRIVKGQGLATGSFTPPTAPVTTTAVGWTGANAASSITGTVSILTNFTNAGITDATAKNDLETVGNAQISTTQSKFGGSSMYFDGTGDYLRPNSGNIFNFGTGDFTVEFWLYLNSTGNQTFIDCRPGSAGDYMLFDYNSNALRYYVGSTTVITGSSLSTGQWYHIALSRISGTARMFINGTQTGSTATHTTNLLSSSNPYIASNYVPGDHLNGYIDDLRITKGYARYTANFTAPTAALPLQ